MLKPYEFITDRMIHPPFHKNYCNASVYILFLLTIEFFPCNGQSSNRIHYNINWLPSVKEKVSEKETVQVLKFANGVYRTGNDLNARMIIMLPYTFNGYEVNAEITNANFESLKE